MNSRNIILVRPCLTRVNFIIAKGLLGASVQELVYLPTHFHNQASRDCSRQKVFQFYVLEEAWRVLQLTFLPPISLCSCLFLFFRLAVLFLAARQVHFPKIFSLSITIRKGWYCSGSWGDAQMPSFLEGVIVRGWQAQVALMGRQQIKNDSFQMYQYNYIAEQNFV